MSSSLRGCRALALVLVASIAACSDAKDSASTSTQALAPTTPSFTKASGSTSTLLGRKTFSDPKDPNFQVKRMSPDWHVDIKAKPALDIAVQSIDFPAGSKSGWHRHPGPVFIQVVSGTITFYESDDPSCTPIVVSSTQGQGYLDAGEHAHMARNESAAPAQTIVTYFAPPGVALRIDEPRPENCPF
jgi:quercetin dioxygenase-like cupin family protein